MSMPFFLPHVFCLCYVHGNSVKLSILLTHMAFNQSVLQKNYTFQYEIENQRDYNK